MNLKTCVNMSILFKSKPLNSAATLSNHEANL